MKGLGQFLHTQQINQLLLGFDIVLLDMLVLGMTLELDEGEDGIIHDRCPDVGFQLRISFFSADNNNEAYSRRSWIFRSCDSVWTACAFDVRVDGCHGDGADGEEGGICKHPDAHAGWVGIGHHRSEQLGGHFWIRAEHGPGVAVHPGERSCTV